MRRFRRALCAARRARRGFALLAVLWVIVAVSAVSLTSSLLAREGIAAARNRGSATTAMWQAHDCLERVRAAIADALLRDDPTGMHRSSPWLVIDSVVRVSPFLDRTRCRVESRAAGSSLDVNTADAEMLRAAFRATGVTSSRVDSLVDALLDWRDSDDIPRSSGAERSWYESAGRVPPRNASLASAREIALVRGFEMEPRLHAILDVEPGRIVLARAPLPVIAALPGIADEALARLDERRMRGAPVGDLMALAGELSPEGRALMLGRYAELARLTSGEPEAWVITSRARDAASPVTAMLEVRLVRAGTRAAIVRQRSWLE